MLVYGGIDEAGYGPLLGPLTLGRCVFVIRDAPSDQPINLWERLSKGVCQSPAAAQRKGRLPINDSKKLHTHGEGFTGLRHLEEGVLVLGSLRGQTCASLEDWLQAFGAGLVFESVLPWYHAEPARPWESLPVICDAGLLAIARNVLAREISAQGVELVDMGLAVVPEDRFNTMVAATRSKASLSFTFVARHLMEIWERFGEDQPLVTVDRQSGRSHYREPLSLCFPQAHLSILEEGDTVSRTGSRRGGEA
ncbi:MAG: hypothetical protein HC898_03185 [Phycisphaerales bacterium]|nr:hypothetical protein [Phycisphaerales bacterium]